MAEESSPASSVHLTPGQGQGTSVGDRAGLRTEDNVGEVLRLFPAFWLDSVGSYFGKLFSGTVTKKKRDIEIIR
ncbi:hypothetical protein ANCCAN_17123 [Ancylostoma caninum]|uniref:Uncharacterized protein n=1 Tax=Ancylostoma caninum TaxID=29170 RepID=A0A368G1Z9_ANCCA|nr:hypothetical protein ANCCAN_17123 [Ancylostoma caninum]